MFYDTLLTQFVHALIKHRSLLTLTKQYISARAATIKRVCVLALVV